MDRLHCMIKFTNHRGKVRECTASTSPVLKSIDFRFFSLFQKTAIWLKANNEKPLTWLIQAVTSGLYSGGQLFEPRTEYIFFFVRLCPSK